MSEVQKLKVCSGKHGCGLSLPYDKFGVDSRNKTGRKTTCKECEKAYKHKYYLTHKDNTYYVAYTNVLDDSNLIYTSITSPKKSLTSICYEYARTCGSDEKYNAILNNKVSLLVNSEEVRIEDWHKDILKDGDTICITSAVGVTALATIITTAIVAAFNISTYAIGAFIGAMVYLALYAVFSLAITFISQMLFQPDTPDMSFSAGKSTQTYNWNGVSTVARINSPVPIVYGTRIVGGNIISVYTESTHGGRKNYLNILLSLCEGEIDGICKLDNVNEVCETSDKSRSDYKEPHIYLDDQPITYYNNVEWWYRTGTNTATYNVPSYDNTATYNLYDVVASNGNIWECQQNDVNGSPINNINSAWRLTRKYPNTQSVIPHFTDAAVQIDDGRGVNLDWVYYETIKEVDKITVQVYAPTLYSTGDSGVEKSQINYSIEYKPKDGFTWYDLERSSLYQPRVRARQGASNTIEYEPNYSMYYDEEDLWRRISEDLEYDEDGVLTTMPIVSCIAFSDSKLYHTISETLNDKSCYIKVISNQFETAYYTALGGTWNSTLNCWTFGQRYVEYTGWVWIFEPNIYQEIDINYNIVVQVYDINMNYVETVTLVNEFKSYYVAQNAEYFDQSGWHFEHYTPMQQVGSFLVSINHSVEVGMFCLIDTILKTALDGYRLRGKTKSGIFGYNELDFHELTGASGKGIYQIRVKRIDKGTSYDMGKANSLNLQSVTEIVFGEFIYPNTALLGLRILADDQLSGQPPNINTLIRGTKVAVPDLSGEEAFNDMFWNTESLQWENVTASITRTWDEETWQTAQSDKEFSDNFILVARDLLTNTRYGLGKYITTNDLGKDSFVVTVKECHKKYAVLDSSYNYFDWWDIMPQAVWEHNITFYGDEDSNANISFDFPNKCIAVNTASSLRTSSPSFASLTFNTTETLKRNTDFILEFSLAEISDPISELSIYLYRDDGTYTLLDTSLNVGSGDHSISFSTTMNKNHMFKFDITRDTSATQMSATLCVISDINLNWNETNYDHYHTFDGVFESNQSALSVLLEMCEGYRTWPVWISGGINLIMDTDTTPVHTIAMSNCIEFSQSFTPLSEIPSKVSGQFSNESSDYEMTSITVNSQETGLNKLNEVIIGLKGITDIRKAEREVTWKLNKVTQCTETISLKCGIDMLHATAGDIIGVQHDLPSWGQGGIILDYNITNASITVDKEFNFTSTNLDASYLISYQLSNNSFVTATIDVTATGLTQKLKIKNWVGTPCEDSIYKMGESTTYSKPFRILQTARQAEQEIDVVLMEHSSGMYEAEPTLTYKDVVNISNLPNPLAIPPNPVSCSVSQLSIYEGIGFKLSAKFPQTTTQITEIVVEMAEGVHENVDWNIIGVIPKGQMSVTYLNSNLQVNPPNNLYSFRFYARTVHKKSGYVIINNVSLDPNMYSIPAPTGLHVKYLDPNDTDEDGNLKWDGNDITLVWNPAGIGMEYLVKNYKLEIYHDEVLEANLLAVRYSSTTEYTYVQESSPYYSNIIVRLFTVSTYNTESSIPTSLKFINTPPSIPTNLSASPLEDAVRFKWNMNTEVDLVGYKYRTKVETNDWSEWATTETNSFIRELSNYEVAAQSYDRSNVSIQLKSLDKYNNLSATSVTASADCYNYKPEIIVSPTPGLGHFTTIASAVNAASVNGGKILLKEGTHQLTASLLLPNCDLTITGVDMHNVIVENSSGSNGFCKFVESGDGANSANYSFSNFTINSQNGVGKQSAMFYFVYSWGGGPESLAMTYSLDNIIMNLATPIYYDDYIFSRETGVLAYKASSGGSCSIDGTISNCTINYGMYGIRSLVSSFANNYIKILNNELFNQSDTGIEVGLTPYVSITNNSVHDFYTYGINLVYDIGGYDKNITINDNSLKLNETAITNYTILYGLLLASRVANLNVTGNRVQMDTSRSDVSTITGLAHGGSYPAVQGIVDNNTIDINASCWTMEGIDVRAQNSTISNNYIILNNSAPIYSYSRGLSFNYPALGTGNDNLVSNNYIDITNNTASDIGIYILLTEGHYGGGNIIKDAGVGIQTVSGSHNITATYI